MTNQHEFVLMPWGPYPVSSPDETPWGLDEGLLRAGKTITDPVHGDIPLNQLESILLDSPPLQRLRRVRQLGTTHLVYPGATHSRLAHSLGTVRQAHVIMEQLLANHYGPHRRETTLFTEWESQDDGRFDLLFAEAAILARLGGLLHDIGHIPFGHTLEDDLDLMNPHDANADRFSYMFGRLSQPGLDAVRSAETTRPLEGRLHRLEDELRALALSAEDDEDGDGEEEVRSRYPFVADVVGNTICADLLDYIVRDHLHTGLPLRIGDRFLASFFVVGTETDQQHREHMAVRVVRGARKRWDVVTELLKYLRFRYELNERALDHHAKIAADALLSLLLDRYSIALALEVLHQDTGDGEAMAPDTPTNWGELAERHPDLRNETYAKLEDLFRRLSDDGILEHLAVYQPSIDEPASLQVASEVRTHAEALLNRDLPKTIGVSRGASESKRQWVWDQLGEVTDRRRLERQLADIVREPYVLLWVPDPDMRLKPAGVLVDDGVEIAPLSDKEPDAKAIEDKHRGLWRLTVLGPKSLRDNPLKVEVALSVVAEELTMEIIDHDRQQPPDSYENIRVRTVSNTIGLDPEQLRPLTTAVGRGRKTSFELDCARLAALAFDEGLVDHDHGDVAWFESHEG